MIHIKRIILLSIVFLLISSCDDPKKKEKQASGVYVADFPNIKNWNRYNKLFTKEEKIYYKDFYLYINYDGTFRFSKTFYHDKDTIFGTWTIFPEQPSHLIELHGKKFTYFSQMVSSFCNLSIPYGSVNISNTPRSKRLIVKKIKHRFPEMCK